MRTPRALPALGALLALGLTASAAPGALTSTSASAPSGVLDPGLVLAGDALQPVVVTGSAVAEVADAVARAGGRVGRALPLVAGVSADVPASALAGLAASDGVVAVTADRSAPVTGKSFDRSVSASPHAWSTGAAETWPRSRGRGVAVAVLDTGVSPVEDLRGRLVHGPDLSGERAGDRDSFGHGTVMAGLVAGDGRQAGDEPRTGVAPEATVVSVKVAGENGAADVSTVLAGMHWVASFADTYGIRVLNLSWGVPSTQDPAVDPLNHAVQQLWDAGITVVVAAGNAGPGAVLKPGDDPRVITVGAYDEKGDVKPKNDEVPDWSAHGPTAQGVQKPDLVAPGRSLVAVRSAGSRVETENRKAHVEGGYIRGSGTSQAAAVVSGAAALLLAQRPGLTPAQVKEALVGSAVPIDRVARERQGAGRVSLPAAVGAPVTPVEPVVAATGTAIATVDLRGTGSLDASRGSAPRVQVVCDGEARLLDDETTAWCTPWGGQAWTGQAWTGQAWTGQAWTGQAWTADAWSGQAWTDATWTGQAWTGQAWTGQAWTGQAWTGQAWTGQAWTGQAWTGQAWTGAAWGDSFLTSFWGTEPRWWQHVAGEASEVTPDACRRWATCR